MTKYFLDNFLWWWRYETWTAETCTDENRNSVSYVTSNSYAPPFLKFDTSQYVHNIKDYYVPNITVQKSE